MTSDDPFQNLGKWQATSHPDLANRTPDGLFPKDYAERYRRMHHDLWERIIRLHGTIHTLKQLREFPFGFLYGPNDMEFWRLVVENFLDAACLMLHALVNDTGADVHTLKSFKNEIMQWPWLTAGMRDLLATTLRERRFDRSIESIADRVAKIRDARIAHCLIDRQSGSPTQALAAVSLDELGRLFDAAHDLFGALSFGSAYVTLAGDLIPGTVGGTRRRSCLDEVLDAIVRNSPVVQEPELRQPWWPETRDHMAPEDLRILNRLRGRVGLPEA